MGALAATGMAFLLALRSSDRIDVKWACVTLFVTAKESHRDFRVAWFGYG